MGQQPGKEHPGGHQDHNQKESSQQHSVDSADRSLHARSRLDKYDQKSAQINTNDYQSNDAHAAGVTTPTTTTKDTMPQSEAADDEETRKLHDEKKTEPINEKKKKTKGAEINMTGKQLDKIPASIFPQHQRKKFKLFIRNKNENETKNENDENESEKEAEGQEGEVERIESLLFTDNRLAQLPPEISMLIHLKTLLLQGNLLTYLPSEIGALTNLRVLHLSDNQLTSLPPEIGNLANLRDLSIQSNRITEIPSEIGNLSALTRLNAASNRLIALPPEIGELARLEFCDVSNNPLSEFPMEFGCLHSLVNLSMASATFTEIPSIFEAFTRVVELNLSKNYIAALPEDFGLMSCLEKLNLANNQIKSLPTEMGGLHCLKHLDLQSNLLQSLPAELGRLVGLQFLDLEFNRLTTDGIAAAVPFLTSLKILFLNNNKLTSPLPEGFTRLSSLTNLSLEGNTLSFYPGETLALPALRSLYLKDNAIKVIPVEIFGEHLLHHSAYPQQHSQHLPQHLPQQTHPVQHQLAFLDGTKVDAAALKHLYQEALPELWNVDESSPTAFLHRKLSSLVDLCFSALYKAATTGDSRVSVDVLSSVAGVEEGSGVVLSLQLRERMERSKRYCESCGRAHYGEPYLSVPVATHFAGYKVILTLTACSKECFLARGALHPFPSSSSSSVDNNTGGGRSFFSSLNILTK